MTINAIVEEGYTWAQWVYHGSSSIATQNYTFTINNSVSYTATATSNTKSMANVTITCGTGFSVGTISKITDGSYTLVNGTDYECTKTGTTSAAINHYTCVGKGKYTGQQNIDCYF